MKVGIVTDNTANLPPSFIREHDIGVVSLYIMKKGTFSRAVEMSPERYYDELKKLDYVPSTSQPSPLDFENVYMEMLKRYDALISVHISGKLSGTVDSAKMAANSVGGRIFVVDSKLTSWGLGFLVMELVELLKKGVKPDAMVNFANSFHEKVSTYFTVNDLTHLYKGGRIGKARTLLGRLLNARPLLRLRNGEILPAGTFRGKQKLLDALVRRSFARIGSANLKKVAIIHTGNVKDAAHLKTMVEKYVNGNGSRLFTDVCDVVIGTHLGPGAVGIITEWE
ncbi:MAG: fatty acid kinase fatty acid binding subunit [Thermotogota bacterium]|nr:fatty acid kinase fatty acid binding subunit [Thermotogota bacterium]MDK2864454.1 fatty acid kinase fatty acid binding subunit [Thermotogota bacterium]